MGILGCDEIMPAPTRFEIEIAELKNEIENLHRRINLIYSLLEDNEINIPNYINGRIVDKLNIYKP